ncbi:type II toxin-antitoxin system VapC family toxin [Candidatus Woesearchaeota archaeon]|nr:type II toxin-antitoxin system VapC family toxin [Candidatus Woesearchaeota archaeon]
MMLLDTSILIEIEKRNNFIIEQLKDIYDKRQDAPAVTSAVYAEFLFGFLKQKKSFPQILEVLECIEFDKSAARKFAELKMDLEKKGKEIPLFDLITASCAIVKNAMLVTLDAHFKAVPGLNAHYFNMPEKRKF